MLLGVALDCRKSQIPIGACMITALLHAAPPPTQGMIKAQRGGTRGSSAICFLRRRYWNLKISRSYYGDNVVWAPLTLEIAFGCLGNQDPRPHISSLGTQSMPTCR